MPDVTPSIVPCPMCGVDQPAAAVYTLQCMRCKRLGMMCCIEMTYTNDAIPDATLCNACKEKESNNGK